MQMQSQSQSNDHDFSSDKRRTERTGYSFPVSVYSVVAHRGFALNISDDGIFVALSEPLPVGSLVEIELEMPEDGRHLRALGEVRWTRDADGSRDRRAGIGVEFWNLGTEGRHYLHQIIRERRPHERPASRCCD